MSELAQVGMFQGVILESTVGATNKKGLPQFVFTVKATAHYDSVEGVWEDWTEFEEQTLTGYLVLVTLDDDNKPKKCFHYDAVMAATGWDGMTFSGLSVGNYVGKRIAFEVVENNYNGDVSMKISQIGPEDAQLGGLRKLSEAEVKKLDVAFAVVQQAAAKPASAPKKAKSAPKVEEPAPTPAAPTKKKPPTPGKKKLPNVDTCTVDEAYDACWEVNENLREKKVPEEILEDYWTSHVADKAKDPENITPEEAAAIRDGVLVDLGIPF